MGNITVKLGDGNTVGNIGHVINVNPTVRRLLGDAIKDKLLMNVPRERLAVVWFSQGDSEGHQYAVQIFNFLKSNDYRLFGAAPVPQIYISPIEGIVVTTEEKSNVVNICVGPISEEEKQAGLQGRR